MAGFVQTWFVLHWYETGITVLRGLYSLCCENVNAECQPESTTKGNRVALPSICSCQYNMKIQPQKLQDVTKLKS